jgi:hypothetical protein
MGGYTAKTLYNSLYADYMFALLPSQSLESTNTLIVESRIGVAIEDTAERIAVDNIPLYSARSPHYNGAA